MAKQRFEKQIKRTDAVLTEFGANLEPALRVELGERFLVETLDAFFGKIDTEEGPLSSDALSHLGYQIWRLNPIAGPIYVEGLVAGDLLVLEIENIEPAEIGWTGFRPPMGNLAQRSDYPDLQEPYVRITHHKPGPGGSTADGTGMFKVNREVIYPLRPFIGTIVTAPERGVENTVVSQGPWGGNLDCHAVCKGHKVMLNTYHDGGLLFLGDAHAAQGDSEYTGTADETAADIVAKCHKISQKRIPGVLRIETPTSLIQVDSARNSGSMDRALNGAFTGMMQWLVEDYGMDRKEAYLQFSVNPDVVVRTYQFVGPAFYVVGVEFPKKYI